MCIEVHRLVQFRYVSVLLIAKFGFTILTIINIFRMYNIYCKHSSSFCSEIRWSDKKRIAEIPHTYTFTPSGGKATGHLTGALNYQTQRSLSGIKPGQHDDKTNTDPLCHYADNIREGGQINRKLVFFKAIFDAKFLCLFDD